MKVTDFSYFSINRGSLVSAKETNTDYDLNIDLKKTGEEVSSPRGMITSKVACTPGCGMTGTGNSFCCTCKK